MGRSRFGREPPNGPGYNGLRSFSPANTYVPYFGAQVPFINASEYWYPVAGKPSKYQTTGNMELGPKLFSFGSRLGGRSYCAGLSGDNCSNTPGCMLTSRGQCRIRSSGKRVRRSLVRSSTKKGQVRKTARRAYMPSAALKKQAKKLGVKLTLKKGNKRVAKSEAVLRKQVNKKRKAAGLKSFKG